MNTGVGRARVGQWYARLDKGEIFQVTSLDDESHTIEIQTFDGDLDEIDGDAWASMPLIFAERPEDWTGPVDDVQRDDLGYSETDMTGADWSEPLRTLRAAEQAEEDWEDANEDDERFGLQDPALDLPIAAERLG
jgi:uncharacterized protein DUF6763